MSSSEINQTLTQLYNDLSDDYERVVVPIFRPMAKRLLQFVDLRPGWQVLDVGTGTGLLALGGAPRVGKSGRMIGIDRAESMLKIARRKAAQYGFAQCEFKLGDVESLEIADDSTNVVLSQFALHHSDFPIALKEIHRVLTKNGALVFQDWSSVPIPVFDAFYQTFEQLPPASEIIAKLRAQSNWMRKFY